MPRVSVIIPTFDNARYIGEAIQSVLAQDVAACEIIVIDDGSTDDTQAVLASFNGRIRTVWQENQGVSAARNRGLNMARGKYVVFLDADDLMLPDKLRAQMAFLDAHPQLDGVHSGWQLIDGDGRFLKTVEPWHDAPTLDLKDWLLWKPALLGGLMFRRACLARSAGFDTNLRQAEDVDLLCRLSLQGAQFAWLRQPTVGYRQHGGNTVQDGVQQAQDLSRVLDKFFARPDVPRHARRLEVRVRYYTLIWLVWQLHRSGGEAYIEHYLRQTCPYLRYQPAHIALHWQADLAQQAQRDNVDTAKLCAFWPHFQVALAVDSAGWDRIRFVLQWQLNVWLFVVRRDYETAVAHLVPYRGCAVDDLLAWAQFGLATNPAPVTAAGIQRFWQDAIAAGFIHERARADVVALYLTLLGQSVLGKRWRRAGQALFYALQLSWRPKAWLAWGRFVGKAVAHLGGLIGAGVKPPWSRLLLDGDKKIAR